MYIQDTRTYTLKPAWLEVKHYFGLLNDQLARHQCKRLGNADLDVLEKYEKDIATLELNIAQIDEACNDLEAQATKETDKAKRTVILDKIPEYRAKRNYDSLVANLEAAKTDLANDRQARRQKELRDGFYSEALVDLVNFDPMKEKTPFIMSILPHILDGDVKSLTYDLPFALAVIIDFFNLVTRTVRDCQVTTGI